MEDMNVRTTVAAIIIGVGLLTFTRLALIDRQLRRKNTETYSRPIICGTLFLIATTTIALHILGAIEQTDMIALVIFAAAAAVFLILITPPLS